MGSHQKVKMREIDFQEGKGKMLSQKNEEWGNLETWTFRGDVEREDLCPWEGERERKGGKCFQEQGRKGGEKICFHERVRERDSLTSQTLTPGERVW